jgi:hypothetical protein
MLEKLEKFPLFLEDLIKTCGYRLLTNVFDNILHIEEFAKMFLYYGTFVWYSIPYE